MSNSPEVNRRYYEKNKAARFAKNELVRARNNEYIKQIKEQSPCMDCGINYPSYVMDFDHVRGVKKGNVADLARVKLLSIKTLQEEIDKCELVCANCHRERTHARRKGV